MKSVEQAKRGVRLTDTVLGAERGAPEQEIVIDSNDAVHEEILPFLDPRATANLELRLHHESRAPLANLAPSVDL